MSHRRSAKRARRILRRQLELIHLRVCREYPQARVHTFAERGYVRDYESFGGQRFTDHQVWSVVRHPSLNKWGEIQIKHGEVKDLPPVLA